MGVKIGDEIHHHYPPPAPESPALKPNASFARKIVPYLLAAALGAGGAGAGLLPWLLSDKPEPPAATSPDTTRRVEFEKWVPTPDPEN